MNKVVQGGINGYKKQHFGWGVKDKKECGL